MFSVGDVRVVFLVIAVLVTDQDDQFVSVALFDLLKVLVQASFVYYHRRGFAKNTLVLLTHLLVEVLLRCQIALVCLLALLDEKRSVSLPILCLLDLGHVPLGMLRLDILIETIDDWVCSLVPFIAIYCLALLVLEGVKPVVVLLRLGSQVGRVWRDVYYSTVAAVVG